MLIDKLAKGLKKLFKEEQLSDRILRIVEIDENFKNTTKRKNFCVASSNDSLKDCDNNEWNTPNKKLKLSFTGNTDDVIIDEDGSLNQHVVFESTGIHSEPITSQLNHSSLFEHKENFSRDNDQESENRNDTIESCSKELLDQDVTGESDNVVPTSTLANVSFGHLHSSCEKTEVLHAEFPVHSIILYVNSVYFRKLFVESGMKETNFRTITVKVNKGEGKSLEKLIEVFYNPDVLKNVSISDLLSVLDIAARFSCVDFIQYGIEMLKDKKLSCVQECDAILQRISQTFEVFDTEGRYVPIKDGCLAYLSKKLFPLEFKSYEQNLFKTLNHITIMYLLQSSHKITVHEDNTLVFIYMWLDYNKNSLTPDIIELLLTLVQPEMISVNMLYDQLSIRDHIFSMWPGYSEWLVNALKYHSLPPNFRSLRGLPNKPVTNTLNVTLFAKKHFVFEKENRMFCDRAENYIVWHGLQLCPVPSLREVEGSHYIALKLLCMSVFTPGPDFAKFYQKYELHICLLPGNIAFKSTMLESKRFCQRYVRRAEVFFKFKFKHNFCLVARIDSEYLSSLENYGMNLLLFFKSSKYLCEKLRSFHVKPSKKLILLKQDDSLLEF